MPPERRNHHPQVPGPVILPPGLQGGLIMHKVPPAIPWVAYTACGLRVAHDGKLVALRFEPQPITDADEVVALFQLLLAAHAPKPGPIAWETVPPEVQRHFKPITPNEGKEEDTGQSPPPSGII